MSPTPSECPSTAQLREFVDGRVLTQYAHSIETHVLQCQRCVQQLRDLEEHYSGFSSLSAVMLEYEQFRPSSEKLSPISMLSGRRDATPRLTVDSVEIDLSFLAPSEESHELGLLGKYRVTQVLGSGGMGIVLKARDHELERDVAIKVMRPEIASHEQARKRFVREGRALAAINNDYVVPVYEVCSDKQSAYFVMPFLQGETLRQRLQRETTLPQATILKIAAEIAEGLQATHQHGLIHRDIKPANLFVEASTDRCILIDFGLVRTTQLDSMHTQQDSLPGTPAYMSPEQAQGQEFDARSDLFSAGCVLYELATGISPFQRENVAASLSAVIRATAPTPRSQNRIVSRPLSALIMRLLEKSPSRRVQTAEQLQTAVADIHSGRSARSFRTRAIAASVFLAAAVLLGIIIKITHPDGKTTTIETAKGSNVKIDDRGNVDVKLPGNTGRENTVEREKPAVWKRVLELKDQAAYERGVAEWVISHGGGVSVADISFFHSGRITKASDLPATPFLVYHLYLRDIKNIPAEEFRVLTRLWKTKQIDLAHSSVRAGILDYLPASQRLIILDLSGCQINTSELQNRPQLKNLHDLTLDAPQINDGWKFLDSLPQLERLKVNWLNSRKLEILSSSPYLNSSSIRELMLHEPDPVSEEIVRRIQSANSHMRILSNRSGAVHVVGNDPLRQAVERLVEQGVRFGGQYHNGGNWTSDSPRPWTNENPFKLTTITFPGGFEFTQQTAELWVALTSPFDVSSKNLKGADLLMEMCSKRMTTGAYMLPGSDLTDRGLEAIANIPSTSGLYIGQTRVSRDGIDALKVKRPFMSISSDHGLFPSEMPKLKSTD